MAERKKPKKKKPTGGAHKKKRKPMMLPPEWDAVARELAREDQQPKVWYVIKLLKQAAEARGRTDLPPPPWDKGAATPKE